MGCVGYMKKFSGGFVKQSIARQGRESEDHHESLPISLL